MCGILDKWRSPFPRNLELARGTFKAAREGAGSLYAGGAGEHQCRRFTRNLNRRDHYSLDGLGVSNSAFKRRCPSVSGFCSISDDAKVARVKISVWVRAGSFSM